MFTVGVVVIAVRDNGHQTRRRHHVLQHFGVVGKQGDPVRRFEEGHGIVTHDVVLHQLLVDCGVVAFNAALHHLGIGHVEVLWEIFGTNEKHLSLIHRRTVCVLAHERIRAGEEDLSHVGRLDVDRGLGIGGRDGFLLQRFRAGIHHVDVGQLVEFLQVERDVLVVDHNCQIVEEECAPGGPANGTALNLDGANGGVGRNSQCSAPGETGIVIGELSALDHRLSGNITCKE